MQRTFPINGPISHHQPLLFQRAASNPGQSLDWIPSLTDSIQKGSVATPDLSNLCLLTEAHTVRKMESQITDYKVLY